MPAVHEKSQSVVDGRFDPVKVSSALLLQHQDNPASIYTGLPPPTNDLPMPIPTSFFDRAFHYLSSIGGTQSFY